MSRLSRLDRALAPTERQSVVRSLVSRVVGHLSRRSKAIAAFALLSGLSAIVWNGRPESATATSWTTTPSWAGASFPVENFQAYTSPFGYRPSATGGGGYEFHSGLDIAAPEGSYVRSWWAGVVVEVIDDDRCGVGLVIQSGDWEHIYCHMGGQVQRLNGRKTLLDRRGGIQVIEGQELPAAARIGRVGMSGRTTGPHLHWGMRYGDRWVDPALVLRAMVAEG
ncbi:metalloendopeptidase [Leptolyngbya valderiana BDU 20041]|nr:M23 family metallopeptidase [Geitlerinema sp. CS-897]OAB61467.1 metalloendopeptidase [Leptolyngbya valderiana BDU 20041]PPT07707.1 putative peptidase [Geitlerinema sp. FC II]